MALLENKKTKMLLVAAVGAFALSAGAVANLTPVSAEVTPTNIESFVMQDGAGVRTDDKRAIRFTTAIDKEDLNALFDQNGDKEVAVVTMITPTNVLGETPLTSENFFADTDFRQVETVKFSGDRLTAVQGKQTADGYDTKVNEADNPEYDKYLFRACLYNIQVENLTYNFSARSYITVDGEVYDYTAYSEENNSRNIWEVANGALGSGKYTDNENVQNEPYDNLALLCEEYDVKVTNGYTGKEETFTVKRGDKISYENAAAFNALTANVDGQAYLNGLTKADGSAYADEIVTSDLTLTANYRSLAFTENDDGTYSVAKGTLTADDTDTVIISDTYKGGNVTAFASGHKFNGSQFKTIKVSNNITSIPGNAFELCKNLETVIMPSVTKTENINVFNGCDNLKTVVVNSAAKFSRKTFATATADYTPQVDLYIDGTENNITYWRYDDSNAEEPYEHASQNNMLSSNVYYYAENMGEKICCGTWHYVDGASVEKSASAAHNFADGGCEYCEAIDAEGVAYGWDSEKQCYYVANNASLNKEVVEILNEYNDGIHGKKSVSYVADKAFCLNENNGNKNIVTVILPENVKSVGASAFASCTNLETMIMSEVTQTTGTNVFYKCTALTTVVVNANATFNRKTFHTDGIADYTAKINLCVDGAENNITFGDNNGMIANTYLYSADGDCGTWKWNSTHDDVSITVHNERKDGYCANCFAKLDATKAVTYAWDATKGTYYVSADDNVTAPAVTVCDTFDDGVDGHGEKAVTYVANNAFQSNTKIVTVILPESVTSVGAEAFFGCTNLTTVVMAGVTKTEGTNVFYNCTSLTKVVVNGEAKFSRNTFQLRVASPQVDLYIVGTENNIEYWHYAATPPVDYTTISPGTNMLSGVEYYTGEWSYDANGLPVANGAQA